MEPPSLPPAPSPVPPTPDRDDRRALRTLQSGALAVVLVASPYRAFELDRFFVPKETVLHITAALATWWALARRSHPTAPGSPPRPAPVDLLLALYLLLGAASAALATNRWLATRALAISISGVAIFWAARALARRGLGRPLLATAAAATAVAAATSLLQAYGVETDLFSLNRAPGGTFGNRNFVAHLAAIGIPLLAGVTLRARSATGALAASLGLAASSAALVLSRTRAAWLALAAAMVPLAMGLWRVRAAARRRSPLHPDSRPHPRPARVATLALATIAGATAAIAIPNTLEWRSDSPYLDSMRGMVEFRAGSGGGRLKQWRNSARMLAEHPILGVGPGNWPVHYPRHAPDDDPSLATDGTTANPWPSSDWVASASERGIAAVALAAAFAALALTAYRAVRYPQNPEAPPAGALLGATLAATAVAGTFDAVLLLAAPTLLVWLTLGVLFHECRDTVGEVQDVVPRPRTGRRLIAAALAAVAALAAIRGAASWGAMAAFASGPSPDVALATRLDPGSYRIRIRMAELAARRGRCAAVREHAGAARALLPEAAAPRRLLARCPDPARPARPAARRRR